MIDTFKITNNEMLEKVIQRVKESQNIDGECFEYGHLLRKLEGALLWQEKIDAKSQGGLE